jgi:hypothetical protein
MSSHPATAQPPTFEEAVQEALGGLDALLQALRRHTGPAEPWRLLSLSEAADRLGRSERWLRERVRRHEIPVVRLDGKLAFQLDDLIAYATAHRIEAHR